MKVYDPDLVSDDPLLARIDAICREVGNELLVATERFPPFNSPHEGYAVILEELDELWERVKANEGRGPQAHSEAKQLAAMAMRYMLECR